MAFRHGRTDDPSNPGNNSRTRILERLLIQHAEEGIELIELRVQKGKSGYVPTPHYWRNEGDGDDLSDEDGTFLLIGGMAPIDLATEIVDTAREYADETGEHRNYRVVAYRVAPQGPEDPGEEAFRVGLPASMFSPPEGTRSADDPRLRARPRPREAPAQASAVGAQVQGIKGSTSHPGVSRTRTSVT